MNIIPIIAKADTISKSELHKFKIKIMSELVSNGVQIYQFPTDDEAVAEINSVMNVSKKDLEWHGIENISGLVRNLFFLTAHTERKCLHFLNEGKAFSDWTK